MTLTMRHDGYLTFCPKYPHWEQGGDEAAWALDHLVRLHGFTVEEVLAGAARDGRMNAEAMANEWGGTDG